MQHLPFDPHVKRQFLKAGFLTPGLEVLQETNCGVPQGGIISPTIANMVLDGLEKAIETTLLHRKIWSKCTYVRYADDIMFIAPHPWILDIGKEVIINFTSQRGLELNPEKTKVASLEAKPGKITYLGFNIARLRQTQGESIVLMRPDPDKVHNLRRKLHQIVMGATHLGSSELIKKLNPILRG